MSLHRLFGITAMPVTLLSFVNAFFPPNHSTDPRHLADNKHILFIDKSNSHCSDSTGRTAAMDPGTPWCSPAALNDNHRNKFHPGDTIFIKAGDYTTAPFGIATAGTQQAPIALRPYPGDRVTIRGANGPTRSLITLTSGANYWNFEDLTFISTSQIKVLDADRIQGLTLRNCQFTLGPQHNTAVIRLVGISGAMIDGVKVIGLADISKRQMDQTTSDGLLLDNSHNNTICNSHFGDCGHISLNLRNSGNNLIEKNIIENRLHTCVGIGDIPNSPGTASGNVIRQNVIRNYNQFPVWSRLPGIGVELNYASNNLVCNNLIYGGANGASGLTLGADPSIGRLSGNKIYNNTIYQPGGRGIELANFGRIGTKNGITDNKIYNNIIVGIGAPAPGKNEASRNAPIALTFYGFEENLGYGNEIKNNLLAGNDRVLVKSRDANCQLRKSYSLETLNEAAFAKMNFGGDPKFVRPGDFHLAPQSPALRTGQCLREVSTDFDNHPRPNKVCDIGAYQSK